MGKMQDSYDMDGYGYFRIHIASSLTNFSTPPRFKVHCIPAEKPYFCNGMKNLWQG